MWKSFCSQSHSADLIMKLLMIHRFWILYWWFKSFATHKSSKITLLLWSCAIFFTKPDKSNVKPLIFVGHLCLILRATQILRIASWEIWKNPRGRVSLQNNFKIYISLGPGLHTAKKTIRADLPFDRNYRNAECSWREFANLASCSWMTNCHESILNAFGVYIYRMKEEKTIFKPLAGFLTNCQPIKLIVPDFCQIHSANKQFFEIGKI